MKYKKEELTNFDCEKASETLKRIGITGRQFSVSLGRDPSWFDVLKTQNKNGKVTRESVALLEQRMFLPPGSLVVEKEEPKSEPKPEPKQVVSEGVGILIKQIVGKLDEILQKTVIMFDQQEVARDDQAKQVQELAKAIRETQATNQLLIEQMLQKEKEICTLNARLLSVWERKGN